jgi:effector-binding domain-containing protein
MHPHAQRIKEEWDRRTLVALGLRGLALASLPSCVLFDPAWSFAAAADGEAVVEALVRPETLFAGIRRPITSRTELEPRIEILQQACGTKISGPLTHIFRYDTPVEGYDSELGYPVSERVTTEEVKTHTLRSMHFYSALHEGPPDSLREPIGLLYRRMYQAGLSAELELVEVYHHRDLERPERSRTQVMASFLAWPEVYQAQLTRVLGSEKAREIWQGGERITPYTLVDERCAWVAASIDRLKACTTVDQQFDILSRVALIRPQEDIMQYKEIHDREKDVNAVFRALHEKQSNTPFGSSVDPPTFDGKILHLSKPPYDREAYLAAKTPTERRKAYCFCSLVREATDPKIDPIFCYRAAGWARQLWEPVLGVEFKRCLITHSILKGDAFCAWDYHLT